MPIYEYRCDRCDARFELRRPIADASAAVTCPNGHVGARRLLSVFATAGHSAEPSPPPAGGGCGPGCACAS